MIEPEKFEFENTQSSNDDDGKPQDTTTKISFDTEDIVAVIAGLIALMFAAAMIFDKVPINTLTVGIVGFSGAGAVIAKIIKARSGTGRSDDAVD